MKHSIPILLLSTTFIIILGSSNILASIDVSGEITVDTLYSPTGSPYIVTGKLKIMSGATLTINSGVTVKIKGEDLKCMD